MKNKILLAIIFFAVIAFIPIVKINATQVYVGVQISSATAPGYPSGTDSNWCLPTGLNSYSNTQMAITKPDTSPVFGSFITDGGQGM